MIRLDWSSACQKTSIRSLVSIWCNRCLGRRSELESLLGHLSHAAVVVKPGRIFLRHLFTLLSRGQFFVHLNSVARADLAWWSCFSQAWHGTSLIVKDDWPSVSVYTDASSTFECCAVCSNGRWFQIEWPPDWAHIDISVKEMVPIVCAAAVWGQYWFRHRITFYSDNAAVVAVLQRRSARDQQLL